MRLCKMNENTQICRKYFAKILKNLLFKRRYLQIINQTLTGSSKYNIDNVYKDSSPTKYLLSEEFSEAPIHF